MKSLPPFATNLLIYLLLGITIVFLLITLQQLLSPLFFAIMFAYLLYPSAKWMERKRVPRILTNLILIVSTIALLGGGIYIAAFFLSNYVENLSEARNQVESNVNGLFETVERYTGFEVGTLEEQVEGIEGARQVIVNFFTATTNTIVAIALIPVYTFLLLLYRNKFKTFLSRVIPPSQTEVTNNIIERTIVVVPRYLKGLITVMLIMIFFSSISFWAIGIEHAIVFGIVAGFWHLIPYIGTIIGFGIVAIMVLATQSAGLALGVVLLFFPFQFTENNILTPNITGSYVQLNPLVIIMSLIAGALMWGLPGMLLVIPYLAMAKIVCENIASLKPYAYLLGDKGTEEHLPSLGKIKKMFGK